MKESETRSELIDLELTAAGWGVVPRSRINTEVVSPGRLLGAGKRAKEGRADYVLIYRNQKIAVVEAKRESEPVTAGLDQAKEYARKLQVRFAYSTNGHGIYQVDMETGEEGPINNYPTPDELWEVVYGEAVNKTSRWRNRFSSIPFNDKGGLWQPRYYQHNAVTNALEAMGAGQDRILLTLATGTGKTAIAFQIAWKLFNSKWNITDWRKRPIEGQEPSRRPRILFLVDRNILADQAFNAFSAFPEDALVRIAPDSIRKKGRFPKNGSIFFTIFQTFMTGVDENGEPKSNFGEYPPDFFDLIVIDECHRGGARDESNWRHILDYFEPAVQIGLTATPKRKQNADTYLYFGEPVYEYSLKDGINDGYLSPFKVKQVSSAQIDEYQYDPADRVVAGMITEGETFVESDFNRKIRIDVREMKRIDFFMNDMDQRHKTLVFCATQEHALNVRDFINRMKTSTDPNYCVRVTADDSGRGEKHLRTFQDNEKTIPTILTTSKKLSTGVDARNVRNIVLMRPVNSMIEFKQIIGRGTRLFEGKDYFTVYDFVKAYQHFNDPEWDGPPLPPGDCKRCGNYPCTCPTLPPEPCSECGKLPCVCKKKPPQPCPECRERPCVCQKMIVVELADGKVRKIRHTMATSFWDPDGVPLSAAQFLARLYGDLPALFRNEDQLRELWSLPDTRKKLLESLEELGYDGEGLSKMKQCIDADKSDIYDVLAYTAFDRAPISREERVETHKKFIYSQYSDLRQKEFLDFVLAHYVEQGVGELDQDKLPDLLELKYEAVSDAVGILGDVNEIREMFTGFQRHLYL